jgi:hypothetical protein
MTARVRIIASLPDNTLAAPNFLIALNHLTLMLSTYTFHVKIYQISSTMSLCPNFFPTN